MSWLDDFDEDREAVLKRAADAGVRAILNVGFDLKTTRGAIALSERHEQCWATVGLHPHDAADWDPTMRNALRELAAHPKVLAIGETGLDYYYDNCPCDVQRQVFRSQLQLAKRINLPVIIHARDADEDTDR